MKLDLNQNLDPGRRSRADQPTPPDRRVAPANNAVAPRRKGATPWQFDTRVAEPKAAVASLSQSLDDVARSYLGLCQRDPSLDSSTIRRWIDAMGHDQEAAGLFRDLHMVDPARAARLARGVTSLPEPGENFLGFRLIDEIGRGAFGRVYLAQQGDLADRYVALKVSTELKGESQTLAQLQHTNIVPIFSVHQAEPFQAVCMPFYGSTTLKDVFEDLERSGEAPASGRSLLKNLSTRRSASRPGSSAAIDPTLKSIRTLPPSAQEPTDGNLPRPEPRSTSMAVPSPTLRMIGELPYDEAVLWIGSRLADGLAHAHERGILHRDLKPANILLTDDGQPMLLDFNLAQQSQETVASAASVGGTLPYMAPEHLAAFRGQDRVVDERSDLYALGIILFELLARRHPFPIHEDSSVETIDRMIAERMEPPPRIRLWDDRVSPAAESMIRKCLEPDPKNRYQSVRDLHDDLERHLANFPLKHAPEPSIRERARKLIRRTPMLGSWVWAGLTAITLIATISVLGARSQSLARLEAQATLAAFQDDFSTSRYLLTARSAEPAERDRGDQIGRQALDRYGVMNDPSWMNSPQVTNLAPEDRVRLRREVGEALMILAETAIRDSFDRPDPAEKTQRARAGLSLSGLAMACFEDKPPHSLLTQRAELLNLLGQAVPAKVLLAQAQDVPIQTARDFLIAATDHLIRGEFEKALPLAESATRRDPANFWAWFTLGVCHDRREKPSEALACFQTCLALRPDFHHSWFNRGVCYLRDGKLDQARADFDRTIELKPDWFEPYLNRALVRRDLGDFPGAAEDLTQALNRGATETRIYFLRAAARLRAGDEAGARKDREEGLARVPNDSMSWIARATERMATDPAGALADFEKASELDPRSLQALHMRAHILAVLMNRLGDASVLLDRALKLYPDYVPGLCFRGVLRAIQGRREEAIQDAREALWRDTAPATLYQLAGLYATTSKQDPEDRTEAYRLLHAALRQGFGFELIANDHELDPIRDQPEFRRLVESARLARDNKAAVPPKP